MAKRPRSDERLEICLDDVRAVFETNEADFLNLRDMIAQYRGRVKAPRVPRAAGEGRATEGADA